MEQIIKFGISNYLQLCVEAGFSQIQSRIRTRQYTYLDCHPPLVVETAVFYHLYHLLQNRYNVDLTVLLVNTYTLINMIIIQH